MSLKLECGGGLLLLSHATPLERRDVIYSYSGTHILGRRQIAWWAGGPDPSVKSKPNEGDPWPAHLGTGNASSQSSRQITPLSRLIVS